jgi:hypothetical protein
MAFAAGKSKMRRRRDLTERQAQMRIRLKAESAKGKPHGGDWRLRNRLEAESRVKLRVKEQ